MKKLSFLLGTLGGALAAYVFSNKKLRTELLDAKDASVAAKILGRHLSKDGQRVAKEVQQLAEQHNLDDKISGGKKYIQEYYIGAKDEVQKYLGAKMKDATRVVKGAKKTASKKMKASR